MALITRVSRLFQADLHAVLDRIEEPDLLLAQSIREMEEELLRDQQRVGPLQHEQRQLTTREADVEQTLGRLEEELEVCFESAKEDLARALIKRRLEALRYRKFLSRKRAALEQRLEAVQARIEKNRDRLGGMRQQAELLAGDDTSAQEQWEGPNFRVRDEDVEVAFLREKQKRGRS